ncbi:hypothetical protein [Halococcus agarilyticus]|uniref:hypothetical protein n=1 Tax=Halococcus agarilyticus TaxID=1232219 RepID=UPI0006781861|nr:hypothetical protein [Halococcus agarilyticus]
MELDRYSGKLDVLRQLGVLVGLVLFVLVAGYLLTGTPTAGIGAIVGVAAVFVAVYALYVFYNSIAAE